MWVPWVKKSTTPKHTKSPSFTFSFDEHLPSSPIHCHSPSLKDIHTLLNNHNPPSSPLHKHTLSLPFTPARTPAQTPTHRSVSASFKDVQSLFEGQTRKPSVFHRVRTWAHRQAQAQPQAQPPPDSHNRVVVYYTSLRVVRRTYEDCRAVRSILKGYRVKMDERDLAMESAYVDELQKIVVNNNKGDTMTLLPRVYVNGKYVGGVDEIRRMHESGELKRMVQGVEKSEEGVCGGCGGFRFVVCEWCDGSHRVYDDKFGFKVCNVCNVSGLVQCTYCTCVRF